MASCPGDKSVTNENPNNLSNRAQYANNLTQNSSEYLKNSSCRSKGFYPSYTPAIYYLYPNTSVHGSYSTTYINFTNSINSYTRLPITFYSSSVISFVVPIDAPAGTYSVVAVNIYNGNFSPQVNNAYPGILNYSNAFNYVLT